jgi:DNA-directed RNA polymerase alpha subunit
LIGQESHLRETDLNVVEQTHPVDLARNECISDDITVAPVKVVKDEVEAVRVRQRKEHRRLVLG